MGRVKFVMDLSPGDIIISVPASLQWTVGTPLGISMVVSNVAAGITEHQRITIHHPEFGIRTSLILRTRQFKVI